MTSSELKAKVANAFSGVATPEPPLVDHKCDECAELEKDLAGKGWADIPAPLIEKHYANLPLLSAEAFQAFLPAFLNYSVGNFDDASYVPEFTAYALLPNKKTQHEEGQRERWMQLLKLFTVEQFEVVLNFLDFVETKDGRFDAALMKRGRERLITLREVTIVRD